MKFLPILISLCISTSCFSNDAFFSGFYNISSLKLENEAPYIRKNYASFNFAGFDVTYYRCKWETDPAERYIKGEVTSYFSFTGSLNEISFDLRNQLRVDSVLQRNSHLDFLRRNDSVIIQLPRRAMAGDFDSVTIYYQGVPSSSGFGTFTNSYRSGSPVMWTISEPFGAKDWWPCRNGLDDKADSIDIYITSPAQYTSVSNGLRQSIIINGDKKTTHWKHRYPIVSYLVCMAVAVYDEFSSQEQIGTDRLFMQTFSYPESTPLFKEKTFLVIETLKYFTDLLGRYPFMDEKYGHTQFGWGGGMEHQTNTFLSTPDESLMAHELAHQWFGNTITSGTWNEIWLSEGFATMLASMDMERKYPLAVKEMRKREIDQITFLPNGSVYVPSITSVSRIFDGRLSYTKASRVLNTLRWVLGDSIFFKGVNNYLADDKLTFNFAFTSDLQKHFERASGKNLKSFFDDWVYGQGYPSYNVQWSQEGTDYVNIRLSQMTSDPSVSFFALPVALQFKNATQEKTLILDNTLNGETFFEKIGFIADTVIIDPDFWLISRNNQSEKIINISGPKNQTLIYPNPVLNSAFIYLKNNLAETAVLRILDATGKLVFKDEIRFAGMAAFKEINMQKFPKGIYFIHLETNKGLKEVRKIVKQ
ncbi:MAG: M1 family aminopeptidase [Ginsengibacter sp.]